MASDDTYLQGFGYQTFNSDVGEVYSIIPRFQTGGGVNGFNRTYSYRPRLGEGWASTLFSFFKPFLKKGLHEVLNVASNVTSDIAEGKDAKESLKKHSLQGISNILQQPSEPEKAKKTPTRVNPAQARPRFQTTKKRKVGFTKGEGKVKKKLTHKYPVLELM